MGVPLSLFARVIRARDGLSVLHRVFASLDSKEKRKGAVDFRTPVPALPGITLAFLLTARSVSNYRDTG
jgi:hypothetical protein